MGVGVDKMTMPIITRQDTQVFTFQEGDVETLTIDKTANLDTNPMPGSDSDSTFVIDFNGVEKTLTISGRITEAASTRVAGQSVTTINEQISWLQGLIAGNQTGHTVEIVFESALKYF